jgi:glycosyltransferase involved in cell wall biosynthesis
MTETRAMPARGASPAAGPVVAGERKLSVTIVIPMYNERENVEPLVEEISAVMDSLDREVETILVDDGSEDGTVELIREACRKDPRFRAILFRRNFGQTPAMSAGFDHARGDVIVAMDGDLQNDPADLGLLLGKIETEGFDIVSGWRRHRKDPLVSRKLPSWAANWLIGRITGVRLHDYGCSLKAYRAEVLKNVRLYGEMHRFIPALASWVGASITEVPVNHRARTRGTSKYGISRTIRVFLDLITVKFLLSFSTRPLQVFGLWGLLMFVVGSGISLYLTYLKLFFGEALANRPLLMLGVLMILMGVQLISMGLIAEMMVRTYHESQSKPTYVIREIVEDGEGTGGA